MNQEQMDQIHHYFATSLYNQSWDILLKDARTDGDTELLLDTAHASLYHWRQVGEPINILRGQWMLAHVYTMLGYSNEAKRHSEICLRLAEEQQVTDWDLAYAFSARARSAALCQDRAGFTMWHDKALKAGEQIKEEGDKDQFFTDLNDDNWFGMK